MCVCLCEQSSLCVLALLVCSCADIRSQQSCIQQHVFACRLQNATVLLHLRYGYIQSCCPELLFLLLCSAQTQDSSGKWMPIAVKFMPFDDETTKDIAMREIHCMRAVKAAHHTASLLSTHKFVADGKKMKVIAMKCVFLLSDCHHAHCRPVSVHNPACNILLSVVLYACVLSLCILTGQQQQKCAAVHLVQSKSGLSLLSLFAKAGSALHLDTRIVHINMHARNAALCHSSSAFAAGS